MVKLKKTDDGYDVIAPDGAIIGYVYKAPDQAWSYAPWVIQGVYETARGGVNGAQERRRGWSTRAAAVHEICIMNSAALAKQIAA
jgi:hypothetical protein